MKIILVTLLLVTACGEGRFSIRRGKSCTTSQTSTGAIISCEDGSVSAISNGKAGANGVNGTSGVDGSNGVDGTNGKDGTDGSNGLNGTNGTNGIDGKDGAPGMPGKDGSTIEPLIPCPDKSGSYPEVLLCIDNSLYAVFFGENKEKKDVRYSKIPSGSYQTTDGRECKFKVTTGCELAY